MNKVSFFSSVHTQNSTMKRKITGIINMKDCALSLLCIVLRLFKHYLNPLFKHSQLCVRKTQRYLYSFTWESALLNLMLQICGVSTLGQRQIVDQFPPFLHLAVNRSSASLRSPPDKANRTIIYKNQRSDSEAIKLEASHHLSKPVNSAHKNDEGHSRTPSSG